ncbi:stimulated by retinoic acid 13 [Paraphysoderma sedebokerense]|nr:stimulated by retinoic acid 13 [Paraphysoderma sedebokerense]KAI9144412.1 stimulated by retinoic acid 13 [Paraphysoderma sedebokerense]
MDQSHFKPETIQEIFKTKFTDSTTKINKDALQTAAEFFRLFTIEALHRSSESCLGSKRTILASQSGKPKLEIEHLEKNLAQLMLDF